jgi:nucleotide-binding universal stress UspA family protein
MEQARGIMYTKIIVPLDGSRLAEQIVPYAVSIAEAFRVPVELLHVNDPTTMTPVALPLQGGEYLKHISQLHFPPSQTVNCVVEMGNPADVIVGRAAVDRGTLIALATHGLTGIQRWLLGSVANQVVRTARNPVLLVQPSETVNPLEPVAWKTLFMPLDGSALAEKVFPYLVALAKAWDLEINLVRVSPVLFKSYVIGDGLYMDVLTQQKQTMCKSAEDYLRAKIEELQADGLRRVVSINLEGDAASEIIDLAGKTPNSLIAMCTHGRSGINRLILGSVTEKVVHHSHNPVLVVRPE